MRVGVRPVLLAAALVALTGCGWFTADPPLPRQPAASFDDSRSAAAEPVELLRAALLSLDDVGPGYAPAPPPDPEAVPACGGDGVAAAFPRAVRLGVGLEHAGAGLAVRQSLEVHPDPVAAGLAFDAGAAGLDCARGELGGAPVVVSEPLDLGADIGGDRALGWQLGVDGSEMLIVAVQLGEAVVTFSFVAPAGSDLDDRPDALGLTRTGVQRILDA